MSKRRDTGSHPVEELEMKDTISYNTAVQHHDKASRLEGHVDYSRGEHQKGPSGKKGGAIKERKRK
jgi:hypothetical protein